MVVARASESWNFGLTLISVSNPHIRLIVCVYYKE